MISGTAEVYDIGVIGVKTAQLFFGAFRIRIRNLSVCRPLQQYNG